MASVPGKFLNMENIIKKVFDETTDSLRMTTSGTSTIVIDAADDSIAIADRNTGDLLTVKPDGSINTNIVGVTPVSGRLPVDLGGATVNITGDVTVSNEVEITNDVNNPIPVNGTVTVAGISTLAEQQLQTTALNSIDGKLTSPLIISSTNLDVRDLVFATDKVDVTGSSIEVSNTVAISAASLPLPLGASTLAEQQLQTTELTDVNTQLSDVVTNTASIGTNTTDILAEAQVQTGLQTDILTALTNPLTVSATDLDIRNLVFATDKADVSGSSVSISNFPATQPVSATDLDIRNLVFATDKVDTSGSVVALDSTTLAALENITATVDNFPANQNVTIQNLSLPVTQSGTWNINNVTGTISLPNGAATSALQSTIDTSINNLATNQLSGSQKTIVRGGAKGATPAGDITSTSIDANTQALDVSIKEIPAVALDSATLSALENINVTVTNDNVDTDLVSGAIAVTATATLANVSGTNLTNRKFISITPRSSGVFMGDSSVTTSTGTPLFLNQTITLDVSDNVDVYLIVASGSANVRIIEGA